MCLCLDWTVMCQLMCKGVERTVIRTEPPDVVGRGERGGGGEDGPTRAAAMVKVHGEKVLLLLAERGR